MSLVNQNSFFIPNPLTMVSTAFSSLLIDASGEKAAFIVQIPKSGNITKVGFRTGTVTSAQTLRVSLQTVDTTTGDPSGSLYGSSTAGTQTSPASNTNYLVTLGTQATATASDFVAVVIEFDSTAGNLNIAHSTNIPQNFPYVDLYTTSWAKTASIPVLSFEYDDGSYGTIRGVFPPGSMANTTYNSGSTPDEYALYFTIKGPCKVSGAVIYGGQSAAGSDFDLVLYDTDGTTSLATLSVDGDVRGSTSATNPFTVLFSTPATLTANGVYYLSLKPTTTNNCRLMRYTFASAASLETMPGGTDFYEATRTNAGSWTTTNTIRPMIMPILSAIDDGTSTGSGGSYTFVG